MQILTKFSHVFEAKVAGEPDADDLYVEGLASVFGNVDQGGDRVIKGAFAEYIAAFEAGEKMPLLWSHDLREPAIGKIVELRETDEGLYFRAKMANTPRAREIHALVKAGMVDGASFGYRIPKGGAKMVNGVRELTKILPFEISIVNLGMNPAAHTSAKMGIGHLADALSALAHAHEIIEHALTISSREWQNGPDASEDLIAAFESQSAALGASIAQMLNPQSSDG